MKTSIAEQKKALRVELKQRRTAVSSTTKMLAGKQVAQFASELAIAGLKVGLYAPLPQELPTQALAAALWQNGSQIYLPCIQANRRLIFRLWEPGAILQTGTLGIPTPPQSSQELAIEQLDVVFMPLLGFDRKGHRLGMGGGYYDTSLARASGALKIGLAFDCQEVEAVPVEDHDIALDLLITESRTLRFRQSYSE